MKPDVSLDCIDTPSWDDGRRGNCPLYRQIYCRNNSPGRLAGEANNFPEINCCGCGKCGGGEGFNLLEYV